MRNLFSREQRSDGIADRQKQGQGHIRSLRVFAAAVIAVLAALSLFLATGAISVFAQVVNAPQTNVDPIVDGSVNSFPGEYAQAALTPGNGGTIYHQYKQNWNARSVQTANQAVYPGTTLFELNDLWSATTAEDGDYNFFWHVYPGGTKISVWIFAGPDDPDDSDWIGLSGLGYAAIDDRGFLVRKNDNPATDIQWLPGQAEPGDPAWDWDAYHGVFASSYTRSLLGWEGNEVYEVAWHNTGNIGDEPALQPCFTMTAGISDPKGGDPSQLPQLVWEGDLHVGLPIGGGGIAEAIVVGSDSAAQASRPSSGRDYTAPLAAAAAGAVTLLALTGGGWYARRHWLR